MENKYNFQDLYLKYDINILEISKIFSNHHFIDFLDHFQDFLEDIFKLNKQLKLNLFKDFPFIIFQDKYNLLYFFIKHDIDLKNIQFDIIEQLFYNKILNQKILDFLNGNIHTNKIELFKNISIKKWLLLYNIHKYSNLNSLNESIQYDIINLKTKSMFKFYQKIFYYLSEEKLFYRINKYKYILHTNEILDYVNDFESKTDDFIIKKKIFHQYLNNFEKIKLFFSEKLFLSLFPNFDILFFIKVYKNQLNENNININKNLNIYNFYYTNIKKFIFINKKKFYKKYPTIDLFFIYKIYFNEQDNYDEINIIKFYIDNNNIYKNLDVFFKDYPHFNLNIFINFNKNIKFKDNYQIYRYLINEEKCIYSVDTFLEKHRYFEIHSYKHFYQLNNYDDNEIIIHYINNKSNDKIQNKEDIKKIYNIDFIKTINYLKNDFKLENIYINSDLIKNCYEFKNMYLKKIEKLCVNNNFLIPLFNEIQEIFKNIKLESELIDFLKKNIYSLNYHKNKNGLKCIFTLNEVLNDLNLKKTQLKNGISLIIRAKNEEINVKICIESVIDLVDEIIFVNNNSCDKTGIIAEELSKKYNHFKVYHYFLDVNKVGKQHEQAMKNGDKNTLGNYYNWCLSKSNYNNVIKWDADFICIRENFKQMINNYQLKKRDDKFALWFSGITMFIHQDKNFININSFYNEYRIFSYLNNFQWYDANFCEYTDPYLDNCFTKYKIKYPIFYEMKNTCIDEFESRSTLLDKRDIKDFELIELLKKNNINNNTLIEINKVNINRKKTIIIFTNTLSIGGSNLFIIELYNYLKSFGFYVYIFLDHLKEQKKIFEIINKFDIFLNNKLLDIISNIKVDYFICNGFLPSYVLNNIEKEKNKIIFITHSDVAYSNYYIQKYNEYFYKIITVNNYTKLKLIQYLNININKIYKLVNFKDYNQENKENKENKGINLFQKKKKIFGMISRFSEDKNIPMLLFALKNIFSQKKYKNYIFYLVGSENDIIDHYIQSLIHYLNLSKNIKFEGFQENVKKYYDLFDFIVLPSVSEGCSYNVLESMVHQKIMILSEVGGNHELFPENSCIFIEYERIREFEKKHLYIDNYHGQLQLLGYQINNKLNKDELIDDFQYYHSYFESIFTIPSILLKNEEQLKIKWNIHQKNIEDALIKAMEMDINTINKYIEKNTIFYEKYFNKKNYYETLNKIID